MFRELFETVNQWNERLVQSSGISSKFIVGIEVLGLSGFGGIMLTLGQYAAAVLVWLILGFIIVAKAFHWSGIRGNSGLTLFLRGAWVFGGFAFCLFLIVSTNLNRDDKSWIGLPKEPPTIVLLRCNLDHIPIHISAGTSVHVLRMQPSILGKGLRFGAFDDLTSDKATGMDWPSDNEGRHITTQERTDMFAMGRFPNPYASKCMVTNEGVASLAAIQLHLLVDSTDGKRRAYPILIDPLTPQSSFEFYLINSCSFGDTLRMVQWNDSAVVQIAGKSNTKVVPISFGNTNWPSQMTMIFGPSWFVWNGVNPCHWEN